MVYLTNTFWQQMFYLLEISSGKLAVGLVDKVVVDTSKGVKFCIGGIVVVSGGSVFSTVDTKINKKHQ